MVKNSMEAGNTASYIYLIDCKIHVEEDLWADGRVKATREGQARSSAACSPPQRKQCIGWEHLLDSPDWMQSGQCLTWS